MATLRAKDFEPSVPRQFTLKMPGSRNVTSRITNQIQGMFSTAEAAIYLDAEPANDVEVQLREHGIRVGEPFQLIKISTTHGGCRWVVRRPPELEQQLRDSLINVARNPEGRGKYVAARPLTDAEAAALWGGGAGAEKTTPALEPSTNGYKNDRSNGSAPPPHAPAAPPAGLSPNACRYAAAYKEATDVLLEERVYALSKGLALEIHCEDIRCLAATMMINDCKGGVR